MDIHKNARLTPHSRGELVRRVLVDRQSLAAVAAAFGVCLKSVGKWVDRFRTEGEAGLRDRSSRPHCLRCSTPEESVKRLKTMAHVHIGWLNDEGFTKHALAAAGVGVSQDLSFNAEPRNLAPDRLAIAFVSCDGNDDDARSVLNRTLAQGAHLAVIMRGKRGPLGSAGGDVIEGRALPVGVRDTTGAGNSFIAGFLSAHGAGRTTADCLASGHEAAAHTCQIFGGFAQDEEN